MGGAAPWPRPRGLRRARKKTKNDPKRTLASAARAPMRARAASSPLPAGQSGPVSWRSIHWATRRSQSLPPRRPSPATPITSTLSQPVSITLASNVPPPRNKSEDRIYLRAKRVLTNSPVTHTNAYAHTPAVRTFASRSHPLALFRAGARR
eukprot:7773956-Pyramimonas_sp.AAC.1